MVGVMETTTKNEVSETPKSTVRKAKPVRVTKKQEKENARNEAIATLRKMGVKAGTDIYTIVTHVSKSGMQRHIRCYLPTMEDGKPSIANITRLVSVACDIRLAKGWNWDLVVGGYGMDMCFATVYNLASVMFQGQDRAGYMLNARDL